MESREIRKAFLDFFAARGHQVVPSAPLVIKNDPTLMFTNAGMNQFKDIFLGISPVKYPRVANTQKCLRVSGKHNDLEEVGIDTYHHTMFEMLGNWSFGDYFKKEAIEWAWELLTDVYRIPKDRLYVTVFEGDKTEGLKRDTEAYDIWKKLIAEDRIINGNKKDNFWEMGDTGPCGPCSEIHVDLRPDSERNLADGKQLVNNDHPQVIEIWNNVFMQYNRLNDGTLKPLPANHVDTGMGFERLCVALQGKTSNYDTDIFQPLIQYIARKSGNVYGSDEKTDIAMRVMADHIRAIAFAIADGQLPSNTGAGYVIRRILRRAVRYAYTFLGLQDTFLYKLVDILAEQFDGVFPELKSQKDFIKKVIQEEEASFLKTLTRGVERFNNYVTVDENEPLIFTGSVDILQEPDIAYQKKKMVSGSFAFELYDTYGFPVDLTQLMAREINWSVNMEEFYRCMEEQKMRSRAATAIDTEDWVELLNTGSEFVGYDSLETRARIVKYRKVKAKGKEQYQIVLDKTPFYAESGGQVGDTGVLAGSSENIYITDTKKENNLIMHLADTLPEHPEEVFTARVDMRKRILTANNHSATHLLHAALKQVLGDHVAQKGSLVNEAYLRFDFSHFSKVGNEELGQIEKIVNEKIRENIPLNEQRNVPYDEAIQSGVTALFGEKYGDHVRVITFDEHFSKELCGGTHVPATGQIGTFKIVSESAVAAGVRRIEAITADKAEEYINNELKMLSSLKELLKNPSDLLKSVEGLIEENNRLKKEADQLLMNRAITLAEELSVRALNLNGLNLIVERVELPSADAVKALAFRMKDKVQNLCLVLGSELDGKPFLTVMLSDNLVKEKGLNAGNMVREMAKEIQGGGGGQPFYATAGGKNLQGLGKALEKARELIAGA